jgi:hypothetical protein
MFLSGLMKRFMPIHMFFFLCCVCPLRALYFCALRRRPMDWLPGTFSILVAQPVLRFMLCNRHTVIPDWPHQFVHIDLPELLDAGREPPKEETQGLPELLGLQKE